jgi:hypothetical protein
MMLAVMVHHLLVVVSVSAGLGRFGRGRTGGAVAEEPEITNATAEEVEMTAAGDLGTGGPTTRRRAAAVRAE